MTLPDPNVWSLFAPTVLVTTSNSVLHLQRGAQVETDWNPEVLLRAKPRVNFSGAVGMLVEWRLTMSSAQAETLVLLQLHDPEAERTFELTCGPRGDGASWSCLFSLRHGVTQAHLWWGGMVGEPPLSAQPFALGDYHTVGLRYNGGQSVTLLADGVEVLTRDFGGWIDPSELRNGATPGMLWNGMDWLTVGTLVTGWPCCWPDPTQNLTRTTVIDTGLGFVHFSQANDPTPPCWQQWRASRGLDHSRAFDLSGSDGESGFKCLQAAWDGPAGNNDCYTSACRCLSEGEHTLSVRGWDWAGNETSASYTYRRDIELPW